jgi:hypothetical protein
MFTVRERERRKERRKMDERERGGIGGRIDRASSALTISTVSHPKPP